MADDPTKTRTESPTRARRGYSKHILRRQRLTIDLVASLETHEDEIVDALGEILSPFVEEGERLELRTLLRALRRLIQNREDRLQEAAYNRHVEAYEDRLRRGELSRRTAEVRELLLDLRRTAAGYYGKNLADAFLGLESRTSRYSREVLADGKTVLERLADPKMPLPKRRFKHAELPREEWHDLLEGPVHELARVVGAHHQDQRETGDAVTLKDLELERHDHDVNWAARWVVAMYSLVRKEEWASDLSPVSRHRQRRSHRSQTPPADETSQEAEA